MIRQVINVNDKWKVIVYYDVDYNLFGYIMTDFKSINIPDKTIKRIYNNMSTHKAKAVTISDNTQHISIVLFNKHKSKYDYINSIVHEAEHVKQDMLYAYNVEDSGEPPAYTIGFLVMKMLHFFKLLDCSYTFN